MEQLPLTLFSQVGNILLILLLISALFTGLGGAINLGRQTPIGQGVIISLFLLTVLFFVLGFCWIGWFHYRIYLDMPLELPRELGQYLNRQLAAMNENASYGLPLYDPAAPPRYRIPLWIENEKYFFWFFCYALMGMIGHFRLAHHRLRGAIQLLLAVQVAILYFFVNPFIDPLPRFFNEVSSWFSGQAPHPGALLGQFMGLYPKMVFYYNASYMWFHPPLLFLSYACITLVFVTSVFMLVRRELVVEQLGYDFAKLGYFMLTLGMLLGYPWALQAWGPNWWWDPKICSSIMMWAVFSTYLHTRLYANKPAMWYFSAILGIICFLAMIFTFLASFFFPGEHTFQ